MNLQESAATGLQRALLERETARAQLAEANTKIMMLRAALTHVLDIARIELDMQGIAVLNEAADALEWSQE